MDPIKKRDLKKIRGPYNTIADKVAAMDKAIEKNSQNSQNSTQLDKITKPVLADVGKVWKATGEGEASYQAQETASTAEIESAVDTYLAENPVAVTDTTDIETGELIYRDLDKPMFVFMADDGRDHIFTAYETYLKPSGIPLTTVYPYDLFPDQLSVAQLKSIIEDGGEVICHAYSSEPVNADPTSDHVAYREIVESKKMLTKLGIPVRGFLAPGGGIDTDLVPLVKENYSYAFCNYSGDTVDTSKDIYNLNRIDMSDNLVNVKAKIDDAIANNKALCMYCHGIGVGTLYVTVADLQEIIAYIETNAVGGYEFTNVQGIVDALSNIGTKENIEIGTKDHVSSAIGANLIHNPSFETFKRTSGTPIGWDYDTSGLTGAATQSIERGPALPQLNINFSSANLSGESLVITQDVWVGNLTEKCLGFFSLDWLLSRNDIAVSVDLYSGTTLVENLLTFSGDETGSNCNFNGQFFAENDSTETYIKVTITVNVDSASWYAKLWNPILCLYTSTDTRQKVPKQIANVYSLATNKHTVANGAEQVAFDDYDYSSMKYDPSGDAIAPYASGLYKMKATVNMTDASTTAEITVRVETTEGQSLTKTFTPSAATYTFWWESFVELRALETLTMYIDKVGTSQPYIAEGTGLMLEQVT